MADGFEIQLNPKNPLTWVVVGLFLLCFIGFRTLQHRSLDSEGKDAVKQYIQFEYFREMTGELEGKNLKDIEPGEIESSIDRAESVEIVDIRAKGSGDDTIIRVEYTVDGEDPEEGESPLYLKASYSTITGWIIKWEVSSISYYLRLF